MDLDYNPSYRSFIFNNKWVATVASIWIQTTSGYAYTFGVYSQSLKSSQHYDQSTLDTVAVFKDLGANLGVFAGLLYSSVTNRPSAASTADFSPSKNGPWVVVLGGAILSFVGFFFMWMSVVGILPRTPVPLMCFYMFLNAQGTTFFNTANVVTAVHNFPDYRGTSVGIMKGFLGLSGAILIQLYHTIIKNKPTSFILLLALLPSINSVLLMWLVRIFPTYEVGEKKYLDDFSLASLILAAYLMAIIIVENTLKLQFSFCVSTFVVLLLLLLSPLYIAIKAQKEKSYRIVKLLLEQNQPADENAVQQIRQHPEGYREISGNSDEEMNTNNINPMPETAENLNLSQAICTVNFWLLFLTSASGMGSGLATVNNITQIGESLGYSTMATSTLISLWSIWNFLGRFGAGYASDYFLHAIGLSRPLFIVITLAVMSIGHAVIATGIPGALYLGSVLVGICYGSQWSLMPTIAAEVFGSAHMGPIFNTITFANPVGTYILSVRVVGYIYDKNASSSSSSGSTNTCTGTHCFMLSFLIMASATLFGSVIALILFFRTRNLYNNVILVRLRHPNRLLE